jgi:hypothetical protein
LSQKPPAYVALAAPVTTPIAARTSPPPLAGPLPGPSSSPAAFAQTNVFTFGSAPQSNFAKLSDPVQIFYATLSPTVVANGTLVRTAVITTSNAASVKMQIGTQSIGFSQTAAGQWQAAFPFPGGAVPVGQPSIAATLIASRSDGTSASIPIPLNVSAP